DAAPERERALAAALASPDEQDVHLAISEIEELIRLAPPAIDRLLEQLLSIVDDRAGWSPRVRAHAISSAARLRDTIGTRSDARLDFDVRIVPLCLDADPRLAAAALDYLRDGGFLPLLETHVLPNLIAANHHVREQ